MARYPARSASFAITLLGSLANFSCTLQLLAAWNLLKEPESSESEWESSWLSRKWPWHPDGIQLAWGLLLAYFSTATAVCTVGFVGVVKNLTSWRTTPCSPLFKSILTISLLTCSANQHYSSSTETSQYSIYRHAHSSLSLEPTLHGSQ
ncbi:hypothetical protein Moror_16889 [Moniliophthora roreri MCA 2997]|uniref:Uncharacterized protein n=1 Tax=Moniliophthora roreri (strain MCA 2997) TaxID=1381753 RepID=V2XA90_MONRO|nr:hypothetical protein Moror_16889 [Moniliophthora roreri MCA 2997]